VALVRLLSTRYFGDPSPPPTGALGPSGHRPARGRPVGRRGPRPGHGFPPMQPEASGSAPLSFGCKKGSAAIRSPLPPPGGLSSFVNFLIASPFYVLMKRGARDTLIRPGDPFPVTFFSLFGNPSAPGNRFAPFNFVPCPIVTVP